MGLDIGKKRIGVAMSDSLCLTAQPLTFIESVSIQKDIEKIIELAERHEAGKIIAGVPFSMDGTAGAEAVRVLKFIDMLKEKTSLPVEPWDERFSTSAVTKVLIEADVSRGKRKTVIDKLAAAYILQGYLDSLRT